MFSWLRDFWDEQVAAVRGLWKNKRQLSFQTLNLAMVIFSALMIWKGLILFTGSESPVVVVLSGSMEPALERGDILFLDNRNPNVTVGDIVVFKVAGRDIPIVHRVLRVHEVAAGVVGQDGKKTAYARQEYLTKGDNNPVDDRNLYAPGQLWLRREDMHGKGVAAVPYAGMVTIYLNDYPLLKWLLLGFMSVLVLTGKENA